MIIIITIIILIIGVNTGDGYVTIVPALLSSGSQQTMIIPSLVSSIAFTVCGAAGGSRDYSSSIAVGGGGMCLKTKNIPVTTGKLMMMVGDEYEYEYEYDINKLRVDRVECR